MARSRSSLRRTASTAVRRSVTSVVMPANWVTFPAPQDAELVRLARRASVAEDGDDGLAVVGVDDVEERLLPDVPPVAEDPLLRGAQVLRRAGLGVHDPEDRVEVVDERAEDVRRPRQRLA